VCVILIDSIFEWLELGFFDRVLLREGDMVGLRLLDFVVVVSVVSDAERL